MRLIDTHTHLYLPEFDTDRDEMIERAVSSGVAMLLMPNIDLNSVAPMLSAADRYKNICFPMIGLHPTSVKENYKEQLDILTGLFAEQKFLAIGEVGIDLYWDKTFLNGQMEAFRLQVELAISKELPVVIHARDSFPEVFSVLQEFRGEKISGVFHAFSGTRDDANKAIEMGFLLGIGGPVTFKNSKLGEIVREVGARNIVLETDSPYLAPVPFRGKRNESAYIPLINKRIAEILGMTEEESSAISSGNAVKLFKI